MSASEISNAINATLYSNIHQLPSLFLSNPSNILLSNSVHTITITTIFLGILLSIILSTYLYRHYIHTNDITTTYIL